MGLKQIILFFKVENINSHFLRKRRERGGYSFILNTILPQYRVAKQIIVNKKL